MKKFVKYIVALLLGAVAALAIMQGRELFLQTEQWIIYSILGDAFFAVGGLMTLGGLLIFCSNEGAFDGIVYSVTSFFSFFKKNSERQYATYYEYKESRKGKKVKFLFLVLCGLLYVAVGIVMYVMFKQTVPPNVQLA